MKRKLTSGLEPMEAQIVIGVCVVVAACLVSGATFNFVIGPMTNGLNASESQQSLLRQLPNIGALLVIFIAGVLGPRIGPRRFIAGAATLMTVGYALLMVAPAMPVASLGMLLGSVGRQALIVVAIGLLAAGLTSDKARATGFASLAAVSPVVHLFSPLIAGALVGVVSWRAIIMMWVLGGVAGIFAARRLLPGPPEHDAANHAESAPQRSGELWTPALAGFVLTSAVQTLNNVSAAGWSSAKTLTWLALAVAAASALVVLMRRLPSPSLDLSILKHGGLRLLLLLVVILVPFTNLWYYFTVGLQTVYGHSVLESAVIMIPTNIAAMGGAWLSGRLMARRGIRFTGTAMLLAGSASMFLCMTQQVDQPLLIPLLIICLYSGAVTAAGIPLTNAVMNLAPRGGEGSASAFRGAAGSLGAAVGVVLMSSVVYGTFESSLTAQVQASGGDTSQVSAVAADLRDGLSSEETSSQLSVPLDSVEAIDAEQKQAMVDAYRAQGLVGGVIMLVSAGVFALNRQGLTDEQPAPETAPAGAT